MILFDKLIVLLLHHTREEVIFINKSKYEFGFA
jgi:hypothetical protein